MWDIEWLPSPPPQRMTVRIKASGMGYDLWGGGLAYQLRPHARKDVNIGLRAHCDLLTSVPFSLWDGVEVVMGSSSLEYLLSAQLFAQSLETRKGEAKPSPSLLRYDCFTDWTNFRRVERDLNAHLTQMYFCDSILLSDIPLANNAQESPAMGNSVSKGGQRRPPVNNPPVTEFFLLSTWNLSSCHFHLLFLVLCLRPRKKQACFPFCDSSSALRREARARVRRVCGLAGSCSLWPSVSSSARQQF